MQFATNKDPTRLGALNKPQDYSPVMPDEKGESVCPICAIDPKVKMHQRNTPRTHHALVNHVRNSHVEWSSALLERTWPAWFAAMKAACSVCRGMGAARARRHLKTSMGGGSDKALAPQRSRRTRQKREEAEEEEKRVLPQHYMARRLLALRAGARALEESSPATPTDASSVSVPVEDAAST